jgi:hypothetical protein
VQIVAQIRADRAFELASGWQRACRAPGCFDAVLKLVVDWAELQIVLEILERSLNLDELDIELPQMGWLSVAQIGAQQIVART